MPITPKLIVMVSIYNSGDFIENRLLNLRDATHKELEIWCVNANSPDERDHLIPRKFRTKQFKYVKLPDRISVYATWNYIIRNSKGDYITNANTDDLIAPNGYEKLIRTLDAHKTISFAYPSWYTITQPNLTWSVFKGRKHDGNPGYYRGDLNKGGVGHFPVWRKSLHNTYGYFDESFQALADADWWARCWWAGHVKFRWVQLPLAAYLWRNGENLWSKAVNEDEWRRYHQKVEIYKQGKL